MEVKQKLEDLLLSKNKINLNVQKKLTAKLIKQIKINRSYTTYEKILHDIVMGTMSDVKPQHIFRLISDLQRMAHKKLRE